MCFYINKRSNMITVNLTSFSIKHCLGDNLNANAWEPSTIFTM